MKIKRKKAASSFRIAEIFIPKPGRLSAYLACIHAVYLLLFTVTGVPGFGTSPSDILFTVLSFIPLLFFSSLVETIGPGRIPRAILSYVTLTLALLLYAYHFSAKAPVDFRLMSDNIALVRSIEALTVIFSVFNIWTLAAAAVLPLFLAVLEIRFRTLSGRSQAVPLFPKIVFTSVLWILCAVLPLPVKDEFTGFVSGIFSSMKTGKRVEVQGYPYLKRGIEPSDIRRGLPADRSGKPNVFLIMVESFNANFVETKDEAGAEYTPYFNSLIQKGLFIERFYGNSMQTCKGQEATFFSIIPSVNGKLFVDYPDIRLAGFPSVLSNGGYRTIFFQAYHDLKFDNTESAMKRAGFSVVETFANFKRKEDNPDIWGWGVEDGTFYERFFELLDQDRSKEPDKPVFAALATVGMHIPCEGMPPEKMMKIKEPRNIRERYINALALSDRQLRVFFDELSKRGYLKNSIVIITADHSFPMREHGMYNNEVCRYEETFRIPFLVIWDGVITPRRISGAPFSQIDIGPTILDCAGITREENTLLGRSIFTDKPVSPVFLIQPYNGRYLEAVHYPLKYIYHERTNSEEVYDLANDPKEAKNILSSVPLDILKKMRDSLGNIRLNQQLIEENRILPPEKTAHNDKGNRKG
jgi:arylsulfatase A-like enzyme